VAGQAGAVGIIVGNAFAPAFGLVAAIRVFAHAESVALWQAHSLITSDSRVEFAIVTAFADLVAQTAPIGFVRLQVVLQTTAIRVTANDLMIGGHD